MPNEMGENKLLFLHSHNLHHRTFKWTLSWHFTFQPNNSPQVLTNVLYKKSNLLEKDSKQLIKMFLSISCRQEFLPGAPPAHFVRADRDVLDQREFRAATWLKNRRK